ncbi:hypothetical protein ACHAXA_005986 [Cyclostephanos tholiformis]|uniref:Uncharacterized protein n=1 Tax=Cyclostephanos tholiformis TaxID=382380 RepID=A0ABD3SRA7_9STRA
MKLVIVSLSATIVSGSVLHGGLREKAPERLSLPDALCFEKDNVDECDGLLSSNGMGNCVWCEGEEVCLSRANVVDMVEIMGLVCVNEDDILAVGTTRRTMGLPTPPDFNCFHSAWDGENAKVTCGGSRAKDDSPCVWCSLGGDNDDDVAGACLSNEEAIAVNGKFGLTCPSMNYLSPVEDAIRSGIPDVNCLKAAWVAEDAEMACEGSKDASGNDCVWCKTDGDVTGVCLSRPESSMANGQFGLTCPGSELLKQKSFENFMVMQQ